MDSLTSATGVRRVVGRMTGEKRREAIDSKRVHPPLETFGVAVDECTDATVSEGDRMML